mgnify:CR=1 FL=1
MTIFKFKPDYFRIGFKELIGRVDNQLEIEFFDDISLFLENLCCSILMGTTRNKLLDGGYLVSFFKLSSNEKG